MKTLSSLALAAGLVALSITTSGCWLDDLFTQSAYTTFVRYEPITYVGPGGYGANPAITKMWQGKYGGGPDSLADIHDWLSTRGGDNQFWTALGDSLEHFSGTVYFNWYDLEDTCYGRPCAMVGIGDIWSSMLDREPVAVDMPSGAAIVNYIGNSRDCFRIGSTYFGCRPTYDWFRIQWPVQGGGENYWITTSGFGGEWSGMAYFHSLQYISSTGESELDLFATRKATYYGDPNPPEIECPGDISCTEEEPEEDLPYPYGLSEGPVQDLRPGWVKSNRVAFPNPHTSNEIVADFQSALRRVRLHKVPELASLALTDGRLRIASIETVSTTAKQDYFIINFVSAANGVLEAQATVSSTGLLGSVRLVPANEKANIVADAAGAATVLAKNYGIRATVQPRRSHTNQMPAGPFAPFFVAQTRSGETILLSPNGEAFSVSQSEVSGRPLVKRPASSQHSDSSALKPLKRIW